MLNVLYVNIYMHSVCKNHVKYIYIYIYIFIKINLSQAQIAFHWGPCWALYRQCVHCGAVGSVAAWCLNIKLKFLYWLHLCDM
jgi:hypothetical protein